MQTKTPPNRKDMERQLHELSKELELSTFIGKGAISENRELKAQIVELRAENTILRTTEQRLAETEDELEASRNTLKQEQNKIKQLESTVDDLRRRMNAALEVNKDSDDWLSSLDHFVQLRKNRRAGNHAIQRPGPTDAGPSVRLQRMSPIPNTRIKRY